MTNPLHHDPYCLHRPGRRQHILLCISGGKPAAVYGTMFVCPRCELVEFRPDTMPEGWTDNSGVWSLGFLDLKDGL